jgi:hypothetical protein
VQYGYNDQLMISGVHILKLHKILRDKGIGAQFTSFKKKPLKGTGTRIPDPLFPHLVPPAIMVWIFVWKYIFEPFIHILQHFVLQLSRSTNFCF